MLLLALSLLVAVPSNRLPDYTDYVVDKAGVLGPVEGQLKSVSSQLDHAGIAQIAICTITEAMLGDDSKEDFAADLFRKWGLGHGKKADGILIFFAVGKGPGHRRLKVEVGYGLEGVLPDGKVGALEDQYAGPALRRDDYATAAVQLQSAIAAVLQSDAAAGGDAAPGKNTLRGGKGVGQPGATGSMNAGGLVVTLLSMLALIVMLATSGARRQFPGAKTQIAAAGLTGVSVLSLIAAGSGAGWLALVIGLILAAVIWTSIRAHRCPKDGSWMTIDEEVIDPPTYWSSGVAHVTELCTSRKCGYRREFDKEIPRKQMTTVVSGGGGGGGSGDGGGGDGFSGGGGGDSGGGGAGRDY